MNIQAIVLLLIISVICIGWQTKSHAKTKTPLSLHTYDSELGAVVAAVSKFNAVSIAEDREYIGGIFEQSGRFNYSVMAGAQGQDQITTTLRFPKNVQLVALWHTHGAAGPAREYFSDIDTAIAQQLNLPFYLADHTYELKVYRPDLKVMSAAKAQRLGLNAVQGYSEGEFVMSLFGVEKGRTAIRHAGL